MQSLNRPSSFTAPACASGSGGSRYYCGVSFRFISRCNSATRAALASEDHRLPKVKLTAPLRLRIRPGCKRAFPSGSAEKEQQNDGIPNRTAEDHDGANDVRKNRYNKIA